MTKEEISKLPEEEQSFIYSFGLQDKDYDEIKDLEDHKTLNLAIYKGWV